MPNQHPPLKREGVLFSHGLRIYSAICLVCGPTPDRIGTDMSENSTLHKLICDKCGGSAVEFMRDPKAEAQREFFTVGGGKLND